MQSCETIGDPYEAALVRVPLDALISPDSPRIGGTCDAHALAMAESDAALPPILVHRPTMRIIDGAHRVEAARLRGQADIEVRFYDGDDEDAFILGVSANIAHGLPLSTPDRSAAAARIIASRPGWSDRRIAAVTGLGATTVGAIRRRSTDPAAQSNVRVGLDGRARPDSAVAGRIRAVELMRCRPDATIREIAAAAGVSASTALDVRRRLRDGEHPVPERYRGAAPREQADVNAAADLGRQLLCQLREDPSLRFTEGGRALLRWLDQHLVTPAEWGRLTTVMPPHCAATVSDLARENARVWRELAVSLDGGDARERRSAPDNPDRVALDGGARSSV